MINIIKETCIQDNSKWYDALRKVVFPEVQNLKMLIYPITQNW